MKTILTKEQAEALKQELERREMEIKDIIEFCHIKPQCIYSLIIYMSTYSNIYSPRRGVYKVITKADYEAYEKEHATKLEDLYKEYDTK